MKTMLPSDLYTEQRILSGCLQFPEQLETALENIKPDDFYSNAHRQIFQAIVDMSERKEPIDLGTLAMELKKRGELNNSINIEGLVKVMDNVPIPSSMPYSCKAIEEKARLRALIHYCNTIQNKCHDETIEPKEIIDQAQRLVLDIGIGGDNFTDMQELTSQSMERYEDSYENRNVKGIKTGFLEFDSYTGGFKGSKLIIIAGRPRMGKTALMLNMAKRMATHGHKVGILSLEMDKEELDDRFISGETGIDTVKLHTGEGLSKQNWKDIVTVSEEKYNWPIIIDDTGGLKIAELKRRARKMKKAGCEIIFIDQLSKIVGDRRKSKFEEATGIVEEVDRLKKELRMPIVLLAQIRRVESDKMPTLENLKNTGQLEEDADMVILIHRPYEYNRKEEHAKSAQLSIAKNRLGPSFLTRLEWDARTTTFSNPTQ